MLQLPWCSRLESNQRPPPYQGGALPTELRERRKLLQFVREISSMERETGIEPALVAWKATVLPLNYSRPGILQTVLKQPTKTRNAIEKLGGGRWIRTTEGMSQQIYSLPPLAAWVSLRNSLYL